MGRSTIKISIDHRTIRAATDFVRLVWDLGNSFSAPQLEPKHNSDPYEVLGISPQATLDQVNERYRNLAKIWHPDAKGGNLDAMKRLNEAYDSICKERKLTQS